MHDQAPRGEFEIFRHFGFEPDDLGAGLSSPMPNLIGTPVANLQMYYDISDFTDDFYETLKIFQKVTSAEIQKSYLLLAKITHPDINGGDPKAADGFVLVGGVFTQ